MVAVGYAEMQEYSLPIPISLGPGPEADPYRWYLCVENRSSVGWSCMQTSKKDALYYYPGDSTVRTSAIPIYKYSPPFLDKYLLIAKLTPVVKISQSTQS